MRCRGVCIITAFFFTISQLAFLPARGEAAVYTPPQIGFLTPTAPSRDILLHGLELAPDTTRRMKFMFRTGEKELLPADAMRQIKYFLTALTIPENDLWVNLSPFEADRIISYPFGVTDMGRGFLEQDYILKQFCASLLHPESVSGREFWARLRQAGLESAALDNNGQFKFIDKVWITPRDAVVKQDHGRVYIRKSRLQVMFREDPGVVAVSSEKISGIIREVLLPYIDREVNEGKLFITLRQMYAAMILAEWFKRYVAGKSVWRQAFIGQKKVGGLDIDDPAVPVKVFGNYLRAVETGVFNYVHEDVDPGTGEVIPRKYFAGGISAGSGPSSLRHILRVEDNDLPSDFAEKSPDKDTEIPVWMQDIPPRPVDVNSQLKDQVRKGLVCRVTRKADGFVFKPEVPYGIEPDLIRVYSMTAKTFVLQKQYAAYLEAARARQTLLDVLQHHAEAFRDYTASRKEALVRIASEIDLYLVNGSFALYHDGPLTHIRWGTYRQDNDLSYSGIWLGERVLSALDQDEFATFLLLEARNFLDGNNEKMEAHPLYRKIAALSGSSGETIPLREGQIQALTSLRQRPENSPSNSAFFINSTLPQERQLYKESLAARFADTDLTVNERMKVVNALARISDEALRLRRESWPFLEAQKISRQEDIDAVAMARNLLAENKKYALLQNEDHEPLFTRDEIESLLFKKLIPYAWVDLLHHQGASTKSILFLCQHSDDPLGQWEKICASRAVYEKDSVPPPWALLLSFSGKKVMSLWENNLKNDREELVNRGVDRLWATYLVLTHPGNAVRYWNDHIEPKKIEIEKQRKLNGAWATYYAVFDDESLKHADDSRNSPFVFFTGSDFLDLQVPDQSLLQDEGLAMGLDLPQDGKTQWEEQIQHWQRALMEKGFEEPLLTYLLRAYQNPMEKAVKIEKLAMLIQGVDPQVKWQEALLKAFKLFHPRSYADKQEAHGSGDIIKHLLFGRGKRGHRNYYQGYIFASKMERDTAIILQYFGLIGDIQMGKNWQVPMDKLCVDFKFEYKGRQIIMEPHKEPQGQLYPVYRTDIEHILGHDPWIWKNLFVDPNMKSLKFRSDFLSRVDQLPMADQRKEILRNLWQINMGRTISSYAVDRENTIRQSGYTSFSLFAFESTHELYRVLQDFFHITVTPNDRKQISLLIDEANSRSDFHIVNSLLMYWTGMSNLQKALEGEGVLKMRAQDVAGRAGGSENGGIDFNQKYLDLRTEPGEEVSDSFLGPYPVVSNRGLDGFKPVILHANARMIDVSL